jgi:HSP20 family molecular chaperone IbpA
MSSQSAATQSKDAPSTVPVNANKEHIHHRVNDRIAGRAYDLYRQEGNRHGEDMRHWLQAESEILSSVPEIRESSSWFTVNVPLKGFVPSEVQVSVEPRLALIIAEKQQVSGSEPGRSSDVFEQAVFTSAKWPTDVDPDTASAYLKNGVLTLTVKRATPSESDSDSKRTPQKAK